MKKKKIDAKKNKKRKQLKPKFALKNKAKMEMKL